MAKLADLVEDGLELLGTVALGTTVAIGDPAELATPVGSGQWHGTGVRPGSWTVLGRPFGRDPDLLEEIVLVHEDGLARFYDLYDEALPAAALLIPTGRIALLDGRLRTDTTLLASLLEPDELPWVLDAGLVARGIAQNPAHVFHPRGEVLLLSIGLERAPADRATTEPFASADRDPEPD